MSDTDDDDDWFEEAVDDPESPATDPDEPVEIPEQEPPSEHSPTVTQSEAAASEPPAESTVEQSSESTDEEPEGSFEDLDSTDNESGSSFEDLASPPEEEASESIEPSQDTVSQGEEGDPVDQSTAGSHGAVGEADDPDVDPAAAMSGSGDPEMPDTPTDIPDQETVDPADEVEDATSDTAETDTSSSADDSADADEDASDDDSDGQLFEDDFASELSGADAPGGGGGGDFDMGGGGGGGGGDFGMGGGDQVDLSDDALDMGEGGGDFGMGGGGDSESFDDEELDSEIDRIELGIEGLDAMIQGGVPHRTLMVTIGSAGTGKTTFGLQFLQKGLSEGERAVYITLEETQHRVIRSATEKGLPFDEYHDRGDLAVVDIDPVEMANSLQSIRSELPRLIEEFGASRLVLDSVSLLEMMYEDQATRRNEIYDFTKALKDAGVTTMMTSEASSETAYASRHGLVEYLTDAVFILQYVRPSDFRETRMAIEIQKIRDAHHSRETKPYEITDEGLSVYRRANIF